MCIPCTEHWKQNLNTDEVFWAYKTAKFEASSDYPVNRFESSTSPTSDDFISSMACHSRNPVLSSKNICWLCRAVLEKWLSEKLCCSYVSETAACYLLWQELEQIWRLPSTFRRQILTKNFQTTTQDKNAVPTLRLTSFQQCMWPFWIGLPV